MSKRIPIEVRMHRKGLGIDTHWSVVKQLKPVEVLSCKATAKAYLRQMEPNAVDGEFIFDSHDQAAIPDWAAKTTMVRGDKLVLHLDLLKKERPLPHYVPGEVPQLQEVTQ